MPPRFPFGAVRDCLGILRAMYAEEADAGLMGMLTCITCEPDVQDGG